MPPTEQPQSYLPSIFKAFPGLVAAESTRLGGVSRPPYASLNLGWSTPDDPEAVLENRRRFLQALGLDPASMASSHQVHGHEVLTVTAPGRYDGYDALITQQKGICLAVTVADCTPILIYDPKQQAIAAAHAGWRGTVQEIVRHTLTAMQQQFASNPADCYAFIGTCIDECSFAVDADVADHFTSPYKRWDEQQGKFFVDLKAANQQQLLTAGLQPDRIEISPFSTVTHNDRYFSHRKEKGQTGRSINVIAMIGWGRRDAARPK
ncbi:MAG: peptidoglycan editing factor PgeF [Lewinellaceae bacterium]|nr:peptidoglycan editing factor PgeF [Lewinellaceae bacterium]